MKRVLILSISLTAMLACRPESVTSPVVDPAHSAERRAVVAIRRNGNQLVGPDGKPVALRGIAFGNEVWSNGALPPATHHTEADYARVKDMGMNVIRFYMNYQTFEDDATPYTYKQTGWRWIDQNIAWARKYGIYLILNIHVPQGGFQSNGEGTALWTNPENQKRLTALWQAIAKRYAGEPIIAGYDLLNEPQTTQSIDQWKTLAQQLTDAIRRVDKGHLIVVERLNAINNVYGDFTGESNLFLVRDENVLYEFHTYEPYFYSYQLLEGSKLGDGGKYPDPDLITIPGDARWYSTSSGNPAVAAGTTGWAFYEGTKFTVSDPAMKVAMPVFQVAAAGSGTALLDDIVVKEYNPNGQFVRDVLTLNPTTADDWYFWSQNNTGSLTVAPEGRADGRSLAISGTTGDANVGAYTKRFVPKQGYGYQISGWLKGTNLPATATAKLRLDFETTASPVLARDKSYLASAIKPAVDWGKKNNVPMYLGEFGVGRPCFQNGKGGTAWVSDMLDLIAENNLHATYHVYHEDSFGIYPGYGRLPVADEGNQPLIDVLKSRLKR